MSQTTSVFGAVFLVVVLCALGRILFHQDPIMWLDHATDTLVALAYHVFPDLKDI